MQGTSLVAALWPARGDTRLWRNVALVALGTALLAVSAKAQVPMWPVPMTMQTMVVLLIGGAYGWRLGGATVLAYLAEGFAGLPVFAGPAAGPAYFLGPTAGYLVGFVLSAVVIGWLVERGWDGGLGRLTAALAVASLVPFVTGVLWLSVFLAGGEAGLTGAAALDRAVQSGLVPFIPGAVLKLALAAALLVAGRRAVERRAG